MKRDRLLLSAVSLALVLAAPGALADDATASKVSLSGFGTLGEVHSSENQADFTSNVFKPNGAGRSKDWSSDVDTLFGGQLTAVLSERLDAMVQIIVEQEYDNSYRPNLEWANLKYEFTPDASARVGRVVMPSFLVSDDRKVGYANPWVRPPVEVYWLVPITKNDGADASFRTEWGDYVNTVQAAYGRMDTNSPDGTTARARNQWGVFDTLESGPLTVHLAYHQAHLWVAGSDSLLERFRQFGAPGNAIADRYECNGKRIPLRSIGANFDPGNWFAMAEWARSDSHCFLGAQSGWYASGGYRVAAFTPYLTYAQLRALSESASPGVPPSTVPVYLAGYAAGLDAGLDGVLSAAGSERTVSAGVRWDARRDVDVKLQFDRVHLGAGSAGVLLNVSPGFKPGGAFNLVAATLDFVF
jgi:hypothetical protein